MAVLCIGAEQIKVLVGFSDDSRCTVARHKLNDRKSWNRQCATNFESHKDLLIAPSLDALSRVARQFRNYRGGQQIIVSNREIFPHGIQPCFFRFCKIEADDLCDRLVRVPLGATVLSDIKARWHFILFGVIFTVAQVGDHIVGRNMVFACFLSGVGTRNEAGIQKEKLEIS